MGLERAAGTRVDTVLYPELTDLEDASAVVLSGSFAPWSVHDRAALDRLGDVVRRYDGPVLGICAGMQLQAVFAGGSIGRARNETETGFAPVEIVEHDPLFRDLPQSIVVYQHHSDEIVEKPDEFRVLARSGTCAIEAIAAPARRWWGTQFHPEVSSEAHPYGERILRNFFELAGVRR